MIDISTKLRDLRLEKNLKQKEVAKALNIATNTLSQFENNKGRPSLDVLLAFADFFGCSIDYLVGREDDFGNVSVSSNPSDLSKDEKTLLERFRKLGPFERESILVQIDALSSEEYNARVYGAKPLIKK